MANIDTARDKLARTEARPVPYLVYAIYVLALFGSFLFAALGAAIAYLAQPKADDVSRTHLKDQVRLFTIAAIWIVPLFILSMFSELLTIILIGYPLLWLFETAMFLVIVWLAIKSLLGASRLWRDKPAL